MALHKSMRLLSQKWTDNKAWPLRIEWVELTGIRGWSGQRVDFTFPISAIVGENGSGKSTILQAAASVYRQDPQSPRRRFRYASDFFPDTPWDRLEGAQIRYSVLQGRENDPVINSIRRPTTRWRGNSARCVRHVEYIDLSRILPVLARPGYLKIANSKNTESSASVFDAASLNRLSAILGRRYDQAKIARSSADERRSLPVISLQNQSYSGFHQGAGETMMAELLRIDPPRYSLVIIDEIESSLHPRAQRRLIWDLATLCREREWQVLVSTHSPYILAELPPEGRICIMPNERRVVHGVSPDFAMTLLDDERHPDCDIYVEDGRAGKLVEAVLVQHAREHYRRCQIIPYGAASVGKSLGQMVEQFPRASCVFLDGDQEQCQGVHLLPGGDAPERVVFAEMEERNWAELHLRLRRPPSEVIDACTQAMTLADHHDWVSSAADRLVVGGEYLWQVLCEEWAEVCVTLERAGVIINPVLAAINTIDTKTRNHRGLCLDRARQDHTRVVPTVATHQVSAAEPIAEGETDTLADTSTEVGTPKLGQFEMKFD